MKDHRPTGLARVFGSARPQLDWCGKASWGPAPVGNSVSSVFDRFNLPGRLPVPRQQCLELMLFGATGYHTLKYIGEPGQRFDAVQFRTLDERRNDPPVPSAAVISGEEGIFAGYCYGSDGTFNGVGIEF